MKYLSSIDCREVGLTIATTTGCNFKCPYCYESGVKHVNMSQEVENAIVRYIKSIHIPIDISWYGGEPLTNWDTIKRLTAKIAEVKSFNDVSYTLITNGYALTPDKCDFFSNTNLKHIQITLDGVEDTHNKSRVSKSGKPSYKTIMENIDYALKTLTHTYIAIRVNISTLNKDDYPKLRKEIYDRWGSYRNKIGIHFAFVVDYSCDNSTCFSTKQQIDYVVELYKKYNIIARNILPVNNSGVCCANKSKSFVIAPDGSLYKCWVDLGKVEKKVGSIFEPEKITNLALVSEYFADDKFSDPKCANCSLLPICGGLCPAVKEVSPKKERCPYDSRYIDNILEILYDIMQQAKNPESVLVRTRKIIPK